MFLLNRMAQGEWGRRQAQEGVDWRCSAWGQGSPLLFWKAYGSPLPPHSASSVPHTAVCLIPTCKVAPWRTILSRRRTPSPMVTPFPMETLGPSCGEDHHTLRDLGTQ